MGSDYRITTAQPTDFDAIVALLQKNAAGNGGALNGNYPPERVAGMLERATAYTLVAKREGTVVGVLLSALSAEHSPLWYQPCWMPGHPGDSVGCMVRYVLQQVNVVREYCGHYMRQCGNIMV
ncbi:hypothetical protein [Pantoea rwandensis]|uniref:hypothetical protein n=1 Tax=Pantoea rwandensis TaxID=1076550 RepID=UPI001FE4A776|nr:hypothetical protein [Pantoea rwandensis]